MRGVLTNTLPYLDFSHPGSSPRLSAGQEALAALRRRQRRAEPRLSDTSEKAELKGGDVDLARTN
jgi:hypothetical protein